MNFTVQITTKLWRQFGNHYDTFLFAPNFIQELLYIDSQLRLVESPEITLNLNELCRKVVEGVERSFLILGESGSGKTSFALKCCHTLWGEARLNDRAIIPIYVYLPVLVSKLNQNECNSQSQFNIVKTLEEEFGIHGIQRYEGQIVFILDSFDEISTFPQRSKIVQNIWTNTLSWAAQVSVLTCSRPEAVPKLKRQEMFEFVKFGHVGNRKYSEYSLDGLSGDKISNFLDKMEVHVIPQLRNCRDEELIRWSAWGTLKSKIQDWKSGDYNQWFQDLPDLRKLSENPYILTLVCLALPGIVNMLKDKGRDLKKLCKTRVGIFQSFTEQIFEYQAERVSQRPDNLKPGAQNISYRDWLIYFRAYAQNLAGKMFNYTNEVSVVKMSDKETLDSSLVEPILNIAQLEKLEKDHGDMFPPRLTHYEETECGTINPIAIENMRILRDACNGSILVYLAHESGYRFIHRSMFEYFASEQAFESSLAEYDLILGQTMDKDNSSAIYEATGFGRALIKHRDILSQLVERMSIEYKKILFKLIRVSKTNSRLHRISANAITILNKAHVCFSGQDYRDIQIQGADLRQSICAHTDFRGANLTDVQFGESYLVGAQFQGACMEGVDFGEYPFLKLYAELNSVVSYKDQEDLEDNWVIATRDGVVRIWNTLKEELVLPQNESSSSSIIDTRLSLLDGKVAVWDESTKFPPTRFSTARASYKVSLYDLFPKWKSFKTHTLETIEGKNQVYIQFYPEDKCVFVYSTCHMEVHSYLSTNDSDIELLVRIGDGHPSAIFTFVSVVDKSGYVLIACHEKCIESKDEQIVVYKYVQCSNHFEVVHKLITKPYSTWTGKFVFGELDRMVFKPDGSGLVIYNKLYNSLKIYENYSDLITPVQSDKSFESFAFDKIGKYLAGLTLTVSVYDYTIIIWNVPSGTIHRQFESSRMFSIFRLSSPFAFSSDSKLLVVGSMSEFNSSPTMRLKSIDENPTIGESSRHKTVDYVAVSGDGKIVVTVGTISHTNGVPFNSIEIFNFPFQDTVGLSVHLPKDMGFDLCLIGIINSKNGVKFKKIIVIQKVYCRAIVICSKSGSILQNFRFEETLNVNIAHLACVNRQTSYCAIFSPTQGYFLWKILENENLEIIFKRMTELELISKICFEVSELRFDFTGRYLQLVSAPLIHKPEWSKIILIDTEDKSIKEIIVGLSASLQIPILSVDTNMINNIIFLCSRRQLHLFNPFEGTFSQQLDYNFNFCSKIYFDPSSGWLFATCRDNSSLVIFQEKDGKWGLALEIPLWFDPDLCLTRDKNNKIAVLIGGLGNLCYIEIDKNNCHTWRLLWSKKYCHKLTSLASNVERALRLSKRNEGILKGLGASGEPHQNIKYQYLPLSDWCQEIFGTARSKFHTPFVKTAQNNFILSEDIWVVSLVGNLSNIRKWRAHVYFIVEGIKNNRRFITRIHLTYSKELKEVSIVVYPVVDTSPSPANDHSWEGSKYIEFVHLADKLSAQQYSMRREECEQFLRNIQLDMQVKLDYNVLTQNCAVWCEKQLDKVKRVVYFKGFTFALIFPRVYELFTEMVQEIQDLI